MYAVIHLKSIDGLLRFFHAYPRWEEILPRTAMMTETDVKTFEMPNSNKKVAFEFICTHPQALIPTRIVVIVKAEDKFTSLDLLQKSGITVVEGWSLLRVTGRT
jgi:hypothetical protein